MGNNTTKSTNTNEICTAEKGSVLFYLQEQQMITWILSSCPKNSVERLVALLSLLSTCKSLRKLLQNNFEVVPKEKIKKELLNFWSTQKMTWDNCFNERHYLHLKDDQTFTLYSRLIPVHVSPDISSLVFDVTREKGTWQLYRLVNTKSTNITNWYFCGSPTI